MTPESSDQRRWYRFSLATLLIALTLFSLSFALAGVPMTLYFIGWLAAMAVYFVVARRLGTFVAFFALLATVWAVAYAMQAVHYAFR